MTRPDVVAYLQENLPKFPIEELRRQLHEEGVSEWEFNDSLAEALRSARDTKKTAARRPASGPLLLALAALALAGAAIFALSRQPAPPPAEEGVEAGESGFVGPSQWVVRLPQGYVGTIRFKGPGKRHEIVHFSPKGTDPTNFLNEGLFGQLGIVRLEVFPSPFPDNPTGVSTMAQRLQQRLNSQGEKFTMKNIQVATLPGVQVNVEAPFPRVEGYVLGKSSLYYFYAGQEDQVWRDIVLSLRDARSEN